MMTRVDEHGIPCIVQSISISPIMATVKFFDNTEIFTGDFFRSYSICAKYNLDACWGELHHQIEGWAGMMYRQRIREANNDS